LVQPQSNNFAYQLAGQQSHVQNQCQTSPGQLVGLPGTVKIGQKTRGTRLSADFDFLIRQCFVGFIRAREFKRVREHSFALFHAGNHVGAAEPMRVGHMKPL
jgi:hypothetical protein